MGGAIGVMMAGILRIYKTARNVEKLLEHGEEEKTAREKLAVDLKAHIEMEEARDKVRDVQLAEMTSDLREITREIRPNGGSSMKDVVNQTNSAVSEINTRVAVLEEWKRSETK